MNTNNTLFLRRRSKISLPHSDGRDPLPRNYIASMLKNLEALGFTFSESLIEACRALSLEQLTALYQELLVALEKAKGAHQLHKPMYPNFPAQVMEMSYCELYINAILHYLTKEVDLKKPIVGGHNRSLEPAPFRPGGFAPHTVARAAMILESMDDAEAWAHNFRLYPENFPHALGHTLFTIKELLHLYREEHKNDRNGDQFLSRRFRSKLVLVGGGNPCWLENGTRERLLSINAEHEKLDLAQLKVVRAQEFEKSGAVITPLE